jgi:exopolyphosphatase/guanosine-5'-triphosphate,3'-diphosphate pyrophosphatase
MGPREREVLEHAAMLHDIGTFLSHSRHERHAHYLIRHADLLGFDETDIATIAALARFHRKGYPRPDRPELADLDAAARKAMPRLSVLLRLAESLDRSHAGLVDGVRFALPSADEAEIVVRAASEPTLELWGARMHQRAFQKAFGRSLRVRLDPDRPERP